MPTISPSLTLTFGLDQRLLIEAIMNSEKAKGNIIKWENVNHLKPNFELLETVTYNIEFSSLYHIYFFGHKQATTDVFKTMAQHTNSAHATHP